MINTSSMRGKEMCNVIATGAACAEIAAEQTFHNLSADMAGIVIGGLSGALLYYLLDRRATKYARERFIAEFVEE